MRFEVGRESKIGGWQFTRGRNREIEARCGRGGGRAKMPAYRRRGGNLRRQRVSRGRVGKISQRGLGDEAGRGVGRIGRSIGEGFPSEGEAIAGQTPTDGDDLRVRGRVERRRRMRMDGGRVVGRGDGVRIDGVKIGTIRWNGGHVEGVMM